MNVSFEEAVELLKSGKVVALPTETVYGLAASIDHPEAIENIFALKGRPRTNPLIVHVSSFEQVLTYASQEPPGLALLARTFWPGPLTLVVPIKKGLSPVITASLATAAFRVPALEITRRVIAETGPLVMPSANLSGRPSSTSAEHVTRDFGDSLPVLDGGKCQKGLESTILVYGEKWRVGRLGSIPLEALEAVLGYSIETSETSDRPLCPGQLEKHYSPSTPLTTNKEAPFVLGFKERKYLPSQTVLVLGSLENPQEVAENLYDALRELDKQGASSAYVDLDFPRTGLWKTIAERLFRAGNKHF